MIWMTDVTTLSEQLISGVLEKVYLGGLSRYRHTYGIIRYLGLEVDNGVP